MKQLHAVVHGRVQGVFFRQTTKQKAVALGLVGWVRNLPNGTVEVKAAGTQDQLESLVAFLHQGPTDANVTQVDLSWSNEPDETFEEFRVEHFHI